MNFFKATMTTNIFHQGGACATGGGLLAGIGAYAFSFVLSLSLRTKKGQE